MEKITINGVEYKLTPVENEITNSNKAKFHEGDWCYRKDGGFKGPIKITKVLPLSYEAVDYIGYHHSIEKYCLENNYRLWAIADAKDGDVLRLGCVIAMFKKYIGQEKCICYCSISEDGDFEIPIENGEDNIYGCTNATPATNEQRDTLFDKMKEAGYEWDFEKKELKKIEAKEAMHDKPKFKVGDWIVFNGLVLFIKEVVQGYYRTISIGGIPNSYDWGIDNVARLWTIRDAKDGDVIFYDDGWTCIFKYIHGIWYSSCCFITADGEFHTGYEHHAVDAKINGNANPATKEQRDFLFSKMNEAGYEWDADKKELKKYTPIFTVGDTIIKKPVSDINFGYFTITDINGGKYWYNDRIICEISEQNDWKLVKQKPAEWESEENEYNFKLALRTIELDQDLSAKTKKKLYSWLKSLRPQPKQDWGKEDENRLNHICLILKCSEIATDACTNDIDWLKSIKNRIQQAL